MKKKKKRDILTKAEKVHYVIFSALYPYRKDAYEEAKRLVIYLKSKKII